MAQGWCICAYVPHHVRGKAGAAWRIPYVALQYGAQIRSDGGDWNALDLPQGNALVKVRATASTLTTIATDPQVTRLPKDILDTSLADLTAGQKNAIQAKLNALGYTNQEIQAALGANIGTKTLRDVLRFAVKRYTRYRADPAQADVVLYDQGDIDYTDPDAALSGLDASV